MAVRYDTARKYGTTMMRSNFKLKVRYALLNVGTVRLTLRGTSRRNARFSPQKAVWYVQYGTFCFNFKSKVRYASKIQLRYVTLVRYDFIPK